jgi:hypothetical protein
VVSFTKPLPRCRERSASPTRPPTPVSKSRHLLLLITTYPFFATLDKPQQYRVLVALALLHAISTPTALPSYSTLFPKNLGRSFTKPSPPTGTFYNPGHPNHRFPGHRLLGPGATWQPLVQWFSHKSLNEHGFAVPPAVTPRPPAQRGGKKVECRFTLGRVKSPTGVDLRPCIWRLTASLPGTPAPYPYTNPQYLSNTHKPPLLGLCCAMTKGTRKGVPLASMTPGCLDNFAPTVVARVIPRRSSAALWNSIHTILSG